jgi:hypothetical protein
MSYSPITSTFNTKAQKSINTQSTGGIMKSNIRKVDQFPLREAGAISRINLALQASGYITRVKDYLSENGNNLVFSTMASGRLVATITINDNGIVNIAKLYSMTRESASKLINGQMSENELYSTLMLERGNYATSSPVS